MSTLGGGVCARSRARRAGVRRAGAPHGAAAVPESEGGARLWKLPTDDARPWKASTLASPPNSPTPRGGHGLPIAASPPPPSGGVSGRRAACCPLVLPWGKGPLPPADVQHIMETSHFPRLRTPTCVGAAGSLQRRGGGRETTSHWHWSSSRASRVTSPSCCGVGGGKGEQVGGWGGCVGTRGGWGVEEGRC